MLLPPAASCHSPADGLPVLSTMARLTWRRMLLLLASLSAAVLGQAQLCAHSSSSSSKWRRVLTLDVAADGFTHTLSPLSFPDCVLACTELAGCRMFGHSSGGGSCWLYDHWVHSNSSGAAVPDTRYWDASCPSDLNYTLTSGVCFKGVTIRKNWTEAREYCRQEGGDLLVADTVEKLSILTATRSSSDQEFFEYSHIGGMPEDGVWRWLNGKAVLEGWFPDLQRDNSEGRCLGAVKGVEDGLLGVPCDWEGFFLCELQP